MPYRLTPEESIARGLRRVVREEIDAAVEQLRTTEDARRDEGIHEARKSIKKLRGVTRMLMPVLGEEGKTENVILRDVGRTLSEFRDAAAMVETVDGLMKKYSEAKVLHSVRHELVRRRNAAARQQDGLAVAQNAISVLRSFKRRINPWPINTDDFATIGPGLRETYQRGRKALKRVHRDPAAVNFHEFRKRVKDHWYHVRLLETLWISEMDAREKALNELQEWLGDDHNLAVLQEKVTAEPALFGGDAVVAAVIELTVKLQQELREKSLPEGERIYAEKPEAFIRRLENLWHVWRGRPEPVSSGVHSAA